MKLFSNHISVEDLVDFADDRLEDSARAAVEQHLATCNRCTAALLTYQRILKIMRSDELQSAPPHVTARALQLFKPVTITKSERRSLLGHLLFDSGAGLTPALGIRSGQTTAPRQLLYNIAEFDIDIRIESRGNDWILSGQLLGDVSTGSVALISAAQSYASELNELGEFTFSPVSGGAYQLRIALPEVDITIPELSLGG